MSAESPATPTKNADGTRKPTEKEAMFFFNILGSMKNKPDVDWDAVAEKSGLANGRSAATRFSQIKKGLGWTDGVATTSSSAAPRTPKTARPKKEKSVGSGANITPSKITKPKTPRKKNPKISKGEVDDVIAATNHYLHDDDDILMKSEDYAVKPKGEDQMETYGHQAAQYTGYEQGDAYYDAEEDS